MSDQAEAPPKKIGSLRDRIAAFEKAGTGSAGPAPAPPAPRPKPAGFSSWKPRAPSPTSGEASQPATSPKPSAGLSTADAKESITKGQSLKERMAALQGKGAFGGPPPVAPKPALEKPKWKPPPVVSAPKDDDDDEDQPRKQLDLEGIVRAPPALGGEPKGEGDAEEDESKESHLAEGEEGAEPDPEEEERQRRAAIAARLARLGGARVGMAPPPVFGKRPPPPPKKRTSVSEDVAVSEQRETVSSPKLQATEPEAVSNETIPIAHSPPASEHATESSPPLRGTPVRKSSEAGSLVSVESSESHQSSRSPPAAMPVPAAPRRAAPPRKKPAKPAAPPPPVPEVESEQQEETSALAGDAYTGPAPEAAPPSDALLTPLPLTPAPSEQVPSALVDENPANTEEPEPSDEDVQAEVEAPAIARAQSPVEVTGTKPEEQEGPVVEPEVEVDEETKRRQVAERIARMGGINPFSAQGPPRKSSDAKVSSPPPAEEELDQHVSPPPPSQSRRSSKLSETPLSPPLPATQEKRLSQGSIDLSHGHLVSQEPTFEEPPPVEEREEDETTKQGDIVEQDAPPVSQSLPEVTKSDSVRQQGARPHEDLAEADGDSEYSNDDDDLRGNTDIPPAVPPAPQPHHSPAVPHRGVPPPPPPVEDDDRASEEEYNEDMVRSQILPPVGGVSDKSIPPVPQSNSPTQQEEVGLAYEDSGSEYEDDEEVSQTPARSEAPSSVPPPPPGRPNLPARSPPPPANRSLPPAPPAIVHSTSQDSLKVPAPVEVLDDDEGDPIDPSFHSPSRRTSQILPSSTSVIPAEDDRNSTTAEKHPVEVTPEPQEVSEAARRKTLADRMAKLGGIQFGAVPTPGLPRRPPPQQAGGGEADADTAEGSREQPEVDEEEEERARKERIAAKLAGMGGMRIGMMPSAFPPRKSHVITGESATPAPPPRAPLAPPPPPPQTHESESEVEGSTVSDDAVKVEADESDLEEVRHEDAEEEPAPPPVPSRSARPMRRESVEVPSSPPLASSPQRRPPVPVGLPPRRPSTRSVGSERRVSGESAISPPPSQRRPSAPKPHTSEYVMVEEPQGYEEEAPPLPPNRPAGRRTSGPPTRSPPPPLAEDSISSQWELPAIPTSNLDIGGSDLEMSWTEAEAPREVTPAAPSLGHHPVAQSPPPPPPVQSAPVGSAEQHLSADDLMALWGRVGVQVCEAAMTLFERSKKGLIGDGTYPGFIHAVIHEVPNALLANDWGYLIYKQNGPSVQKRASDIMPGDLVELHDAKLKGHKGLQVYHQNVGAEEAVVGVIGEFDAKKSKIKVFQANQHVGQQTVETVSYRLEDLKSGVVKVYRVLEAR